MKLFQQMFSKKKLAPQNLSTINYGNPYSTALFPGRETALQILQVPLPERWQCQPNFRTSSHGYCASCVKTSQSHPFYCDCKFSQSLDRTSIGTLHNHFLFEELLLDFCYRICRKHLLSQAESLILSDGLLV